ncbi:MAG: cytidylate kinase-like family protein [Proteobacteria bacterium]|jgi:CMP/dCMP kinase|nr:cytidylate kinase-like family protein [Pseudomonadota bacterium]
MSEHSGRDAQTLVEEQIKKWSLKVNKRPTSEQPEKHPVITVSREWGAQGAVVARSVADSLGFSFWDHELVHTVAEETGMEELVLDTIDEHSRNPIEEIFAEVLMGVSADSGEYVHQLSRIIHTIENHGSAVLVGRGARFVLAESTALHVRVVAPFEVRVAGYQERFGCSKRNGNHKTKQMDADRQAFIKKHYKQDSSNPSHFDLVVNTGLLSTEAARDLIVEAYRIKFKKEA